MIEKILEKLSALLRTKDFRAARVKLGNYFQAAANLGYREAAKQIASVLRRVWFFAFFQTFMIIAFFLLPQGIDALQCLIEDFLMGKYVPVFALYVGIIFWSFAGEFGIRLRFYIAEINNFQGEEKITKFRKDTIKLITAVQFLLPVIVFLLATIRTFIHHYDEIDLNIGKTENMRDPQNSFWFMIAIYVLIIYLMLYAFIVKRNLLHGRFFDFKTEFEKFMASRLDSMISAKILKPGAEGEQFLQYARDNGLILDEGDFKHERINFLKAYPSISRRLMHYVLMAFSLFILFGFVLRIHAFYVIGTPAILCFGIACWLIFFYTVRFLDKAKPFYGKMFGWFNLPYSTFLFFLLILVSYFNIDHPLRYSKAECKCYNLMESSEFLQKWISHRQDIFNCEPTDTTKLVQKSDSMNAFVRSQPPKEVVLLFVGAEGGALRTGAFANMLLGAIQDTMPEFASRIFAYSTVSGGTFGANIFNASYKMKSYDGEERKLFKRYIHYYENSDFLAPVAAKLMFGDFLGYFLGYYECLDREAALEQSWEGSWNEYLGHADSNKLAMPFYEAVKTDGSEPAVFINSTQVETGNRAIISNVKLNQRYFKNVFDLNYILRRNISYATAISLSSRFPLVSPAACVDLGGGYKTHFVDGGYFDNMGGTTMLELLESLSDSSIAKDIRIVPMVMQIVFDADGIQVNPGINFGNELSEIVGGIYNTRSGHTALANIRLREKLQQMGGYYLEIPVANSNEEVPMNWLLSKFAVEKARYRIQHDLLGEKTAKGKELRRFLCQLVKNKCDTTISYPFSTAKQKNAYPCVRTAKCLSTLN